MIQSGKDFGAALLRGLCIVLGSATLIFGAAGPGRRQFLRTHHMRPVVTNGTARFVKRLPTSQSLRLDIVLPLRDPAGLSTFLQELYDASSPSYRHFLTVAEFTARFGPSQEDYDAVVHYVQANGLKVAGGSRDGMDVQIEGSVKNIEKALSVKMGVYRHPTENRTFYAPDREPTMNLPFPLWHISGLDNYSIPRPAHLRKSAAATSHATTGSGPSASFLGSDMRAAYYGNGPLTGAGQSLGLVEFYGTDLADVATYFKNVGQTNNVPIDLISTDGTSTSCSSSSGCDDTEQSLDITQAVSMAPGLTKLYVFVGSTASAILSAISTTTPLTAQLSSSWTWSPADPSTNDPYFEKFAAQGQSFFQASGDSGEYTTTSQSVYPSDDAYVTVVGGTDLSTTGAGGSWASETAWADGGGGYYTPDDIEIPSWQTTAGVITSANDGSTNYRNSPDVSANSNFTYYVCANQTTCTANEFGGTSFAAPLWAGYLALANQQAVANGGKPLGFLNPLIYPLGLSSGYSAAFHDITSSSNGYPAVAGYDLATGWGSMNGASLINALVGTTATPAAAADFSISASPAAITVPKGSFGNSPITTTALNGFNSAVALLATGLPTNVTVSFSPASVHAPGSGTSTMMIRVSSRVKPGTYNITIMGTGGDSTHTATFTLTVQK
jgi:kumamolisin